MKKLLIVFFIFFANTIIAQEISIEKTKENILYRGVRNPVKAIIEKVNCSSIILKSDDAEITKNGCHFNIITSSKKKEIQIEFYNIIDNDTLFVKKSMSRLKDIPNPTFTVSGQTGGRIPVDTFKKLSHGKFKAYSDSSFFCMTFPVSQFKMIITRKDMLIGVSTNISNKATLETKELMKKVQQGDKVYIVDINCKALNKTVELNPVTFKII